MKLCQLFMEEITYSNKDRIEVLVAIRDDAKNKFEVIERLHNSIINKSNTNKKLIKNKSISDLWVARRKIEINSSTYQAFIANYPVLSLDNAKYAKSVTKDLIIAIKPLYAGQFSMSKNAPEQALPPKVPKLSKDVRNTIRKRLGMKQLG